MADLITRQAAIDAVIKEGRNVDSHYLESERIIHECDAVEAIAMLPPAHPEQRWIPVSERLPELDVYVIATTQWHEITMACRIGDGEWFIDEGNSNAYDDDVVAWMPPPEPYKESEK